MVESININDLYKTMITEDKIYLIFHSKVTIYKLLKKFDNLQIIEGKGILRNNLKGFWLYRNKKFKIAILGKVNFYLLKIYKNRTKIDDQKLEF